MLHHVSIEVPPEQIEAAVGFWKLLGFRRVDAPEPIAGFVTWLDRDGTHIHLIHTPEPAVPQLGHAGVVVDDFAAAVGSLRDAGFDVDPARQLWGAERAFTRMPGGHLVELMAAAPPPGA
jgi:catechol 2,3-dioxygenase-like lactoylglutathione lyase family enzyme